MTDLLSTNDVGKMAEILTRAVATIDHFVKKLEARDVEIQQLKAEIAALTTAKEGAKND